jgi:hypothetical protein
MQEFKIPFEIHITTAHFHVSEIDNFVNFCIQQEAKPIFIELSKGDCMSQPMFTKVVYMENIEQALSKAREYVDLLFSIKFNIQRIKIEVPLEFSEQFQDIHDIAYQKYYEWHGKIDYTKIKELNDLCEEHKAHLSLNALKNQTDLRFITLREFGSSTAFKSRVNNLTNDLTKQGWTVFKQHFEYCIFDDNTFLDNGWLTN